MKGFQNWKQQQERANQIQMFDELAFKPNKNKSKLLMSDDSSSVSDSASVSSKFLLKQRRPKQKTIDLLKPYAAPSYNPTLTSELLRGETRIISPSDEISRINSLNENIRGLASSIITQKHQTWQNPYLDTLAEKLRAIADMPVRSTEDQGPKGFRGRKYNLNDLVEKQKQFSALQQSEEYKAVFGTKKQVSRRYAVIAPRIRVQQKREEVYDKPRIVVGRAIATMRGGDPWGKESENKSTSDIAHQSFDFFGNILTKKEAPGLNFSDLKNNSLAEAYNSLRKLGIADMFGNLRTSSESKIDIYNQGLFPAIKTLKNSLKRVRGRRDVR